MARFRTKTDLPSWRKLALGTWSAPTGPTAYGALDLDCEEALAYVAALRAKTGEKVTLTHLIGKAAALAIAEVPDVNGFASLGRLKLRDTVDVFFQVAYFDEGEGKTHGKANLAGAKIVRADAKSVEAIAKELREQAEAIRAKREVETTKTAKSLSRIPGPLVSAVLRAGAFLSYDLGLDLRALGIPEDAFGSCMVTNVGVFGIPQAHAPLIPYARCPIIVTVGAVREAPAVDGGQVVVKKRVTLGVAFDHRVADGYHAGVLARRFEAIFADPARALGD